MNIYRLRHYRAFTLGAYYAHVSNSKYKVLQLIKVTPKGYNFLDVDAHRVIFKNHFYLRGYSGKPIPHGKTELELFVPKTFQPLLVTQQLIDETG